VKCGFGLNFFDCCHGETAVQHFICYFAAQILAHVLGDDMKRILIASAATLALSAGSAFAADMGAPAPYYKAPPPPPAYTWTGCYVDAGAGYGLWNQDHSVAFGAAQGGGSTVQTTDGGRGWLGRFGGGCDYQLSGGLSSWVVGAFADYDVMDLTGTISLNEVSAVTGSPLAANENEQGAWYAGGRLGYLITPTVMGFVSGGWTETKFGSLTEYQTFGGAAAGFGYPSHIYGGWFLGGGYEYALNFSWLPIRGLFWKTEYRYSDYDAASLSEITLATGAPDGNILRSRPEVQTITSSLVWRFNWPH
jgi:outer membrane immunogenic protein